MPQKKTIDQIQQGRTNVFSLSWKDCEPAHIEIDGKRVKLNVREDANFGTAQERREFALSLVGGIKETVYGFMGQNGKFQITNGERRWSGARWLDEEKGIKVLLPCMREPQHKPDGTGAYTDNDRNLDLLRTNSGRPLTMIEKARAMKRLLDGGMSDKEIAEQSGCSTTHVNDCITLLSADPSVLKAIADNEIAPSLALDLVREIPDQDKQRATLEAGRQTAAAAAPSTRKRKSGSQKKSKKITAKHLPVKTGKKRQAEKKAAKAASSTASASEEQPALEELIKSVRRSDCENPERYDTLEFLIEFVAGRKSLATATKFVLGGF